MKPDGWLLKTEPGTYSIDDLEREKRTVWDGVTNNAALKNIRAMRPGEPCLIYHTGDEKAVVGVAKIVGEPRPDPKAKDEKLAVVEVQFVRRLKKPVTLAQLRAEPELVDWVLLRQGRLSVVPTPAEYWDVVERLEE